MSQKENMMQLYLKHAQQLFQRYGYKKTTMDDIAEMCNIAKSTLYHYFDSKNDVFMRVIEMEMAEMRHLVQDEVDKSKNVQTKIQTYFHVFHKEMLNKRNIYRVMASELRDGKFVYTQFTKLMAYEKSYVAELLQKAYDNKELTVADTKKQDLPLMAEVLLAAFYGIMRYSINTPDGYDMAKVESMLAQLIPQLF